MSRKSHKIIPLGCKDCMREWVGTCEVTGWAVRFTTNAPYHCKDFRIDERRSEEIQRGAGRRRTPLNSWAAARGGKKMEHPGIDLFIKDIEALPPGHFVEYKKALVLEVFGTLREARTWCSDHGATLFVDVDEALVSIGVLNAQGKPPAANEPNKGNEC